MPGKTATKSVMIQIRNVPAKVHRILKARAAMKGQSLSDYIREDLERSVDAPSLEEWIASLKKQVPATMKIDIAKLIREDRGE